jgi:uncharacterized membrane protein
MTRVLLVGESWVSAATHHKGFDLFHSVTAHSGAEPLLAALHGTGVDVTHMTAEAAAEGFPFDLEGLSRWDVVVLSDVGSNTFLLPPAVWLRSETRPNRLRVLRDWVAAGGGLLMCGGYLSFQGIDGRARWRRTPVEDALPVTCHPWDDRLEMPEGAEAEVLMGDHAVLAGMDGAWPPVLGANEVVAKDGAQVLARLPVDQGGHPLLVLGTHGQGRTAAWTSDIGPHWLSPAFCAWNGYGRLWTNLLGWLAGGPGASTKT